MKPRAFFIALLTGSCFWPGQSQDLSNLFPIAHWPLLNSPDDALGQVAPMQLTNVVLDPVYGAYSNGIYIGDDPDQGAYIQSPHLEALYDEVFAVTLNFKIEELTGFDQPVVILGPSYRYLGIEVQFDNTFRVVLNNANYIPLPGITVTADVYYDLIMIHDTLTDNTEVYLNSILIGEVAGRLDRPADDGRILNVHPGTGTTFKGYWRNLRVYGSEEATSLRDALHSRQSGIAYPNPCSSQLYFRDMDPGVYGWRIVDPGGRVRLSGTAFLPEQSVDITPLPAGHYFIEISDHFPARPSVRSSFLVMNK